MEYLKLIGILIIVVGFALKWDVIAVVLISGLVTGLVSGLSFIQILEIMGKSFVDNRLMSIFLISFPAIALIERYGMKERAAELRQQARFYQSTWSCGFWLRRCRSGWAATCSLCVR